MATPTTTKEALEPCPWCPPDKSDPVPKEQEVNRHVTYGPIVMYWIECDECNCRGPYEQEAALAVSVWNERRTSAPIVAPVVDENSVAFTAYNQAIEDAKTAIRHESQGGGYWAAAYINAIARRCSPFRYTGLPSDADEATREQIVQAITDIQEARESHIQWAAHLRLPHTFECQGCTDHAAHIGDAEYHDEWIARYDNVIAALARVPFATTPPSTRAQAAAEEIHRLCDKLAPDIPNDSTSYAPIVEQIAAIIERCLAGGGEGVKPD